MAKKTDVHERALKRMNKVNADEYRIELLVGLDAKTRALLGLLSKQEEAPKSHIVCWAIRTLADKRGIKISS